MTALKVIITCCIFSAMVYGCHLVREDTLHKEFLRQVKHTTLYSKEYKDTSYQLDYRYVLRQGRVVREWHKARQPSVFYIVYEYTRNDGSSFLRAKEVDKETWVNCEAPIVD